MRAKWSLSPPKCGGVDAASKVAVEVATVRPGAVVGEVAALTYKPRFASLMASAPSEVLELSRCVGGVARFAFTP